MKKTERNQNMPDRRVRNNESVNTGSLSAPGNNAKERYSDANLGQPGKNKKQRYDDLTGTVENGIG